MTASRNISMFFNELAAASYKILRKNGNLFKKKKMCNCFLELCPLNKYFEMKTDQNKKNDGNVFTSETRCFHVFLVELLR